MADKENQFIAPKFGPARNINTDYVDLEDIFADQFFPSDLDFASFFNTDVLSFDDNSEQYILNFNETSSLPKVMSLSSLSSLNFQQPQGQQQTQGQQQPYTDIQQIDASSEQFELSSDLFDQYQIQNDPSQQYDASQQMNLYDQQQMSVIPPIDRNSSSFGDVIMIPPQLPSSNRNQISNTSGGNRVSNSIGGMKVDAGLAAMQIKNDPSVTSREMMNQIVAQSKFSKSTRKPAFQTQRFIPHGQYLLQQQKQQMQLGYSGKNVSSSDDDDSNKRLKSDYENQDMHKNERRERNREHAKKSRIRKRLLLDTLQDQLSGLRSINVQLRRIISEKLPPQTASKIFNECTTTESSLLSETSPTTLSLSNDKSTNQYQLAKPPIQSAKILMEPDFRLIQALQHSQKNFVLSDPSLPDNPIVYASEGFCKLTGYKRQDVLGRNCRFLQGPGTDQNAVNLIRKGVADGSDISVCLLNYKADGTPFWNQFFVAALRDAEGVVINFVGVQCEVNILPISEIKDRVKKLPLPKGYS